MLKHMACCDLLQSILFLILGVIPRRPTRHEDNPHDLKERVQQLILSKKKKNLSDSHAKKIAGWSSGSSPGS